MLDAQRVLADEVLGQLVDRGGGALGLTFQGGFAPADEALVSGDLDQARARTGKELFNLSDFHGSQCW